MKHLASIVFLLLIVATAKAQFLLGGQFGFSANSEKYKFGNVETDGPKSSGFTFVPRLAYTTSNFWFGIDAGIQTLKVENPNFPSGTDEQKLFVFSAAPFARYIKKPVDNFGIWIEGQAGISIGASQEDGRDEDSYFNFTAGIRPGVILFIGNHLSFEASFGNLAFSTSRITDQFNPDPENTQTYNAFGFNVNQNISLDNDFYFTPAVLGSFHFGANWMF